jgi:glyoxylase-like metal-dependent hydrolase (beta-lactamase superfamily II)
VVVVDANILPASAQEVVAEIKRLTPKPVRYVINTHWHSDHHYGNYVYQTAFPGVEFVQHVETRRLVLERDIPVLPKNVKTEYPATIERYKQALATGKTSTGADVTPALRKSLEEMIPIYQQFVDQMGRMPVVPGTLLVRDSLVLVRGERTIVVKHLGKGNTPGDLVVHLPKERLVATGDLDVAPIPFSFYSHLGDWPETLRHLRALDVTTIMPGHGPLQTDWTYVDRLIELFESTWTQVKAAVDAGADLEATRKRVNLESFRDRFAGTDERRRSGFTSLFVTPAVESAFNELKTGTPFGKEK